MWSNYPALCHIPELRKLWKLAFGDTDAFLDSFFSTAFSADRCRCIMEADRIAAALYWFDCSVENQKTAYIYAVATHPDFRNRGLCRKLMADTHAILADRGYASAVLVPQKESLRTMYAGMGYHDAGGLDILTCGAGESPVSLRAIGTEEFARLRQQFLPERSVVQEGENLTFLSEQLQFYTGGDFLLAAYCEKETLHGIELLGNTAAAPGIVTALDCTSGHFRTPGNTVPFAMFHSLEENVTVPAYFGFAFD
ncbi:MAG: GNAT family N-acetyltransferase [Clostridia bacterium]|nr:GNAT family N-acetyltransferase [Clostridia bacterium]